MKASFQSAFVIANEASIRSCLRDGLAHAGCHVEVAGTGDSWQKHLVASKPDVLVLHLDLTDGAPPEMLHQVRRENWLPLLVITSQTSVVARVGILNAGADDCVSWPCDILEILARLEAIRRRGWAETKRSHLRCGGLEINLTARLVTVGGVEVHLTPIEFGLLRLLAVEMGNVISQQQLLHEAWGTEAGAQSRHLRVHLSNMRRKLTAAGFDAEHLRNEPGVGYRLVDPA